MNVIRYFAKTMKKLQWALTAGVAAAASPLAKCSSFTLTLKAPNKNCSRRHFIVLLLSFEENKA